MKYILVVSVLFCLWMVSDAGWSRYRGRSRFSSWGGGRSWGRPSYRSGYKQCVMARKACLVTGPDGSVLRNEACQANTTCSRGPIQIEKDGNTYNFTFCDGFQTRKYNVCMPSCRRSGGNIPELPEPTDPEAGNGGSDNGTPDRLTENTLPPADESEAEGIFCQQQVWYLLACRVTNATSGESVKQVACTRGGTCTRGPGQYMYNGQAVQAYFCEGCQQWNPRQHWGRSRGNRRSSFFLSHRG